MNTTGPKGYEEGLGEPGRLSPDMVLEASSLADGFDGSAVRHGPNHSTIEIWYDTAPQAEAAHKHFRDQIEAAQRNAGEQLCRAEQRGRDVWVCDCGKPGPTCKPTLASGEQKDGGTSNGC